MHPVTFAVAAGGIAVAALPASAAIWAIEKTNNLGENAGGAMTRIATQFNENTGVLRWEVDYSDTITDGFTLAINDGPNPKGHAGELALIYFFDATAPVPMVTALAYNGQNSSNSYRDGDGNTAGDQAADVIFNMTQRNDWVLNAEVIPTADGQRFVLEFIATGIQTHNPLYPSGNNDWFGVGFANKVGWWFHSYSGLNTSYDGDGNLTDWSFTREGWSDKAGMNTELIPAPGSVGIAALAGIAALRRRR